MPVHYTPAALAWLQTLLEERFGHAFTLRAQADGTLALDLPGDARCITLATDSTTFTRADSQLPFAQWDAAADGWQSALGQPLPAPGAASLPVPLITPTAQGLHVAYDVLGLAYWMLSRQEEVGRIDLDEHGRFPATFSHAHQHGYLERPVVDEWLHVLGQAIQRVWPLLQLKQHSFSIKVSHDVDAPSRYAFASIPRLIRAMGGDVLRRRDVQSALRAPWTWLRSRQALHGHDPYNTFDWLMDVSDQHGLTSAFYFICGHTDPHDADYQPEDPRIRQLMRHIHARGHEIGLHPSYGTYQKQELIRQEKQRLRAILSHENIQQNGIGGRMHYLRWEQPTTLQAWSDAGMAYDSTLSYADRPGFRCGTCFEYPAFNPVTQQMLPLRVRPLIAMECTVMAPRYMGLGLGQAALDKFVQLKNACRAVGGCFTLLWHNSQFDTAAERALYQAVLADAPQALPTARSATAKPTPAPHTPLAKM